MPHSINKWVAGFLFVCLQIATICGCSVVPANDSPVIQSQKTVLAEVVFEATVPEGTPPDAQVSLEMVDEITGLAFNPTRYQMAQKEPGVYFIKLTLPLGKTLRYRYILEGEVPLREFSPYQEQIRYRLYQVEGPSITRDQIFFWSPLKYTGPAGRIFGIVRDAATNAPIPDAIISICGITTLTSSTGSFILDRIPTGTHNLVVITPASPYPAFQQGVTIADQASTPVDVPLSAVNWVEVTFMVTLPDGTPDLPLRLLGNHPSLGILLRDGQGGMTTLASRAPVVHKLPDGTRQITVRLPAGYSLEYKYSLGDGFWNGELNADGTPRTRSMVIPDSNITVTDQVETFLAPGTMPYHILFTAPENTPSGDQISIQINPYDWTEPIPLSRTSKPNQWEIYLLNPVSYFQTARYRYCRNDLCASLDQSAVPFDPLERQLSPETSKFQQDQLNEWVNWPKGQNQLTVAANPVLQRPDGFITGVELSPNYQPAWKSGFLPALQDILSLNGGWIVFTPSWKIISVNPPSLSIDPIKNYLWEELTGMIRKTQDAGQNAAIFPLIDPLQPGNDFWHDAELSDAWWDSFYDRLGPFLIYYADLASQSGAKILILGDPFLNPSLPGGKMPGTNTVVAPGYSDTRWKAYLTEIRKHYTGKIFWAIIYPDSFEKLPPLDVDGYYLIYQHKVASGQNFSYNDLTNLVKKDLAEFFTNNKPENKPVIFRYQLPAERNSRTGCSGDSGTCSPALWMDYWYLRAHQRPDVQEQLESYSAVLNAVNDIPEISGFISGGYDVGLAAEDNTASVRGKPASSILWYWFSKWNSK